MYNCHIRFINRQKGDTRMKDHLETAPVIDAIRNHSLCPFCQLREMIERQTVERYLGGAVMEPDIRIRTNAVGFCRTHHQLLMAQKDYHGYALMMQTRLKTVATQLAPAIKGLAGISLFGNKNTASLQRQLDEAAGRCLICENMADTVSRYMDIFMKLYREDEHFREDYGKGPGVCLYDLPLLTQKAQTHLAPKMRKSFLETVANQLSSTLDIAQEDLDALCSSFHYGSEHKNNPRIHEALERAVNLLRGKTF